VTVQLRLHHGPGDRAPGLGEWFARGFTGGGLGRHTAQDLRELLAATSVRGPTASIAEDGTLLQVGCRAADIATACRVLAAFLADPGWREDAAIPARAAWIDELAAAAQDLDAAMERTTAVRTTGDDPRRRPATIDEVRALAWADVRAAFAPVLAGAPASVLVVGDVEAAAARAAIAAAFGALPPRPAPEVQDLADRRWLAQPRPWEPGTHRFAVTAQKPAAQVRILWPSGDLYDITRYRRIGLLAACLDERMRVRLREELGIGYSPGAGRWGSDAWAGSGHVIALVGPPTERVEEAVRELQALAADLPARIDAELLARVRTPTLRSLAATRARNDWWLNTVLARGHRQPFRYAWSTTIEADIAGTTVAELRALAAEILVPERALVLVGTAAP
jgi:zinc protease